MRCVCHVTTIIETFTERPCCLPTFEPQIFYNGFLGPPSTEEAYQKLVRPSNPRSQERSSGAFSAVIGVF